MHLSDEGVFEDMQACKEKEECWEAKRHLARDREGHGNRLIQHTISDSGFRCCLWLKTEPYIHPTHTSKHYCCFFFLFICSFIWMSILCSHHSTLWRSCLLEGLLWIHFDLPLHPHTPGNTHLLMLIRKQEHCRGALNDLLHWVRQYECDVLVLLLRFIRTVLVSVHSQQEKRQNCLHRKAGRNPNLKKK